MSRRLVTRAGTVSREVADARDGIGDAQTVSSFGGSLPAVVVLDANGDVTSTRPGDGSVLARSGNGWTGVPEMTVEDAAAGSSTAKKTISPATLKAGAEAVLATTIIDTDETTVSGWSRLYVILPGISTVSVAAAVEADDGLPIAFLNLSGDTVAVVTPQTWINEDTSSYDLDDRCALSGTYVHASTGWNEEVNSPASLPANLLGAAVLGGTSTLAGPVSPDQIHAGVQAHTPRLAIDWTGDESTATSQALSEYGWAWVEPTNAYASSSTVRVQAYYRGTVGAGTDARLQIAFSGGATIEIDLGNDTSFTQVESVVTGVDTSSGPVQATIVRNGVTGNAEIRALKVWVETP